MIGSTNKVEVVGGEMSVRRCGGKIEIGSFKINYIWHDTVDGKSFYEHREQIKQALEQKAPSAFIWISAEGLWDLLVDKLWNLDYDASIYFYHLGNGLK